MAKFIIISRPEPRNGHGTARRLLVINEIERRFTSSTSEILEFTNLV